VRKRQQRFGTNNYSSSDSDTDNYAAAVSNHHTIACYRQ
jgi:hypothetical protein